MAKRGDIVRYRNTRGSADTSSRTSIDAKRAESDAETGGIAFRDPGQNGNAQADGFTKET